MKIKYETGCPWSWAWLQGPLRATPAGPCAWPPPGWRTIMSLCKSCSRCAVRYPKKTNIFETYPSKERDHRFVAVISLVRFWLSSFFQACCWMMAPPLIMYYLLRGIARLFMNWHNCIQTVFNCSGFRWQSPRLDRARQWVRGAIYEEPRAVLKVFLENELRDAVPYTEHTTRKTVTAKEVVRACVLFAE